MAVLIATVRMVMQSILAAAQLWETVMDGTGSSDLRTGCRSFHFITCFT